MSTLATYIRDQALARIVKGLPAGSFKAVRKNAFPSLQLDDFPALGVYLLREAMNPDGDANVGEPRYIVDATIGISIVADAAKPDVLEGRVDDLLDQIENCLLCDPTFVCLVDKNGNGLIEAIPQLTRTYQFETQSETYLMEARLQMTVQFRVYFAPNAPNTLETIAVTAEPFGPQGDTFENEITIGQSS